MRSTEIVLRLYVPNGNVSKRRSKEHDSKFFESTILEDYTSLGPGSISDTSNAIYAVTYPRGLERAQEAIYSRLLFSLQVNIKHSFHTLASKRTTIQWHLQEKVG